MSNEDVKYIIQRVEDKVDNIKEDVAQINTHMAVYNEQLTQHIEGVKQAREENKILKEYVEEKIKPLEESYIESRSKAMIMGKIVDITLRIIAVVISIIGVIYTIRHYV